MDRYSSSDESVCLPENNQNNNNGLMETSLLKVQAAHNDISINHMNNIPVSSTPFAPNQNHQCRHAKSHSLVNSHELAILATPDQHKLEKPSSLPKPSLSADVGRKRSKKPRALIRNCEDFFHTLNINGSFLSPKPLDQIKRKISFGNPHDYNFRILNPMELLLSPDKFLIEFFSSNANSDSLSHLHQLKHIEKTSEPISLKILHPLGDGDSGSAFKAIVGVGDCCLALKRYNRTIHGKNDFIRIIREAAALSKLNHVNVVKYVESFVQHNQFFLCMEYCNGFNLRDIIDKYSEMLTYPTESQVKNMFRQILEALTYIHSHGIVHYDIKPENIFSLLPSESYVNLDLSIQNPSRFDSSNIIFKVGDFGHCYIENAVNIEDISEGDSRYLAKESLEWPTERTCSDLVTIHVPLPSADIFSLALMVCEYCGSGELPTCGDSWHLIRDGHLPNIWIGYSSILTNLLKQMISDPGSRPSAQHCLLSEFFA